MDKEVVVYIQSGILLSHKNHIFASVVMRWMNPEPITQSEMSQKEKDNYCILIHIYGILKNGNEEFLQGNNGERDIENRLMGMGRGEERVRCMERVTWKLILPYVKWIVNENLLYGSGNSNAICINLEG